MSFWNKLFKGPKEKDINKKQKIEQTEGQIKIPISLPTQAENTVSCTLEVKKYDLSFSLSSEEEQRRIVDFIRPVTNQWQLMSLQLSYGVRVKDADLFMVRYRMEDKQVEGTDKALHMTYFVVIHAGKCFEASYTSDNMRDEGELVFDVPKEYEEPLKQAMDYYRDWQKHKAFKQACIAQEPSVDVLQLNNILRKPLFDEYEVYEAALKKQKLAQRKSFEVNSEEAAKELFFLCQPDYYRTMRKNYTEETVKAYEKYATSEKEREWVIEECKQILTDIYKGNREKIYDKMKEINGRCGYSLGTYSDALAEAYTNACKVLFESKEERFVECICGYLSFIINSQNPFVVKELLDMTEKYYKEKYPEEYERGSFGSNPYKFKSICCELRGRMKELSPVNNTEGFQFVLTEKDTLRQIILWYRKKYNDDEAVKECIAELNCAYGVENNELFLTALDSVADASIINPNDRLSFVAILRKTGEVTEFCCKRQAQDGGFVADYYGDLEKEHWALLVCAMDFYRNQREREVFFENYIKEHDGETIADLMKKSHKGLLTKFKRHYEKEYKRVNGNPLAKTLLKLVDLCEKRGAIDGYKNIVIEKPATLEEITAWEQENNISLSESYKQFLSFANGVCLSGISDCIYGLQKINPSVEHLDPDYINIGETIGDGTMICMSKTNGNVYTEDHGKYDDRGDFAEFLKDYLELLEEI